MKESHPARSTWTDARAQGADFARVTGKPCEHGRDTQGHDTHGRWHADIPASRLAAIVDAPASPSQARRDAMLLPAPSPRISCIICAYDEGPRLGAVLEVAAAHPLLAEVIVVDDGSRDDTATVAARFARVRVISHPVNCGKSAAMATGVAAARHELLMLLDADLKGLRAGDIAALARPVLAGDAEISLSLRGNSLLAFRAAGIDFVSGERVLGKALLGEVLQDVRGLPRFGIEVFMNQRVIAGRMPVAIAHWPGVRQSRKAEKLGRWRGTLAEWRMLRDLVRVAAPIELLLQTPRLLALRAVRRAPPGPGAQDEQALSG